MDSEKQIDTAIVGLLERGEKFRGRVYVRVCPHETGQTVVLDAQPEGARVFHAVGPECTACEAPHEGLDTSGPEWVRVEAADPIPKGRGMTALALMESGLEPTSAQFRGEMNALTGIARAGDVHPDLARRFAWGDLVRRWFIGDPGMPSQERRH